jgi:hypothetical protein
MAQQLPPPSRTVFKCEIDGKVVYSDSPCFGAKRVDVEPTRGLDKSSGAERIGADVRKERNTEAVADALRPVFGESAEQRSKRHHRAKLAKLAPEVRAECSRLDLEISKAEDVEARVKLKQLTLARNHLLLLRNQYRDRRC